MRAPSLHAQMHTHTAPQSHCCSPQLASSAYTSHTLLTRDYESSLPQKYLCAKHTTNTDFTHSRIPAHAYSLAHCTRQCRVWLIPFVCCFVPLIPFPSARQHAHSPLKRYPLSPPSSTNLASTSFTVSVFPCFNRSAHACAHYPSPFRLFSCLPSLSGANILLSKDHQLKLADFGLSRVQEHPDHDYTNKIITQWYRPPEICLGSRHYGAEVDVWSAGYVLFLMFLHLCSLILYYISHHVSALRRVAQKGCLIVVCLSVVSCGLSVCSCHMSDAFLRSC